LPPPAPDEEQGQLPRLFTGLEVPYDVGLALSLKRGGLYGARWMDSENYHITLRFIGDVDHTTANEVTDGSAIWGCLVATNRGRFTPGSR
jgi:hypothetical protein